MTAANSTKTRAIGALAAGLLLCALGATCAPGIASADPVSDLQQVQERLSQSNADYEQASEQVSQLQALIEENEARIAQIEQDLPAARANAAGSMRVLYKMQQSSGGLVELLLASDNFYELISTIQYLDIIQAHSSGAVEELLALADELELSRANLNAQMQEAQRRQEEAEQALQEANAARSELQARIAAQAAAEEAERQAAVQAAEQQQGNSFTTESGNQAPVEVPSSEDAGVVEWPSEKDAFVSEWTARIDAYLAGSPLAGQGKTFAEAAWEYGVDPRFSPAISQVESSKGRYCFLPHNAWGWGSASWGSWEEAIWDHVAGLASGYGGQLTYAGAQKYCPPNADFWYTTVLANMERI